MGAAFINLKGSKVDQAQITKLAIAGAILFAGYKWGNAMVKGAAISLAAVAVGRNIPYVKDVI